MSWLPKRDKLDPVQESEYPPAVRPLTSIRRGEAELPEAGASAVQVASGIDFTVAQEGNLYIKGEAGTARFVGFCTVEMAVLTLLKPYNFVRYL